MLTLKVLAKEIEDWGYRRKKEFLYNKYPNIHPDVVEFVLLRHLGCEEMYNEFSEIDLTTCRVEKKEFTSDEVLKINYADFCTFRNESKEYFKTSHSILETNIVNGTWSAPILVYKRNGEYFAIDGNNRLRMLKCYLKWDKNKKITKHGVYIIYK